MGTREHEYSESRERADEVTSSPPVRDRPANHVLALQQTIGNQAVAQLLAAGKGLPVQRNGEGTVTIPPPTTVRGGGLARVLVNMIKSGGSDPTVVARELVSKSSSVQDQVWDALSAEGILNKTAENKAYQQTVFPQWAAKLPKGEAMSATSKTVLKLVFDKTPDASRAQLELYVEKRFDLDFGKTQSETSGKDWTADALRRTWPVLAGLPASHVAQNAKLLKMTAYGGDTASIGGWYSGTDKEAAISFSPSHMDDLQQSDLPDALMGVNRFKKVVRHEVGHAVDRQMGWSAGVEPAMSSRGGWKRFGQNYQDLADDMIDQAAHPALAAHPTYKPALKSLLGAALAARDNAEALRTRWHTKAVGYGLNAGAEDSAWNQLIVPNPAFNAALKAYSTRSPWYNATNGGDALGGYVYEESYPESGWFRYEQVARDRKVSKYQFRAPGEWFAEAYAAYYEPVAEGQERGALLAQNDPNTKGYFDSTVHPLGTSR